MYHDALEILSLTGNGLLMAEEGWMIVAVFFFI